MSSGRPLCPTQPGLPYHITGRTGRRLRDLRVEVRPGGGVARGRADGYSVAQQARLLRRWHRRAANSSG